MIYFMGDTHGDFRELNKLLETTTENDYIIICGDFGYWRKSKFKMGLGWFHDDIINPNGTKIIWCDGNHEDHVELDYLVKEKGFESPIEISKNILYAPRGSVFVTNDSTKILFMGGAMSTDKAQRLAYFDWFPQEVISNSDLRRIGDEVEEGAYDVIVSHTCPKMCCSRMAFEIGLAYTDRPDSSCDALQYLFERFKPKKWFFGHWHVFTQFEQEGCQFTALNMSGKKGHYVKYE